MSLEDSITQGLSQRLSIIHEQEDKSVEGFSDGWSKSLGSGDGKGKVEVFEDEGVGPETCEMGTNQQVGQYQPSLSDFSGDSMEEDKRHGEEEKWESEEDAVQGSIGHIDVLNDHGLDSDDEDKKGFYSLHDHKRSRYTMADVDVERIDSTDKATSFEFDVTKDHGLNSDSEDEHSEEGKEKENSGTPLKKKKRFKPWKKLRRLFKKERKFPVDESQNKDDSHQGSKPSQFLEQDEEDEEEKLPVSTEEFILSTVSNPSDNLTSGKDTQNGPPPSRQRTESDEGLPLSPDTPSLNFDLDVKPYSGERSAGETSLISADEEERSLQAPNGHYQPTPSPRTSIQSNWDHSSVEFDSVVGTTTLNSEAAKHRISVKPSSRRPSSRYRSPQGTTAHTFDFDVSSLSFASESKFNKEGTGDYSYLINRPVPKPPKAAHPFGQSVLTSPGRRPEQFGNRTKEVFAKWEHRLKEVGAGTKNPQERRRVPNRSERRIERSLRSYEQPEMRAKDTLIRSIRGYDEETEMEQKSAFNANYKDGPMNPSEGETRNISGILDQLIEESKEAAMEVESNVEVEVSPSVSVKEETEDVEEPQKMKEVEERFTFRLPEDEERTEDGDRDSEKAETVEEIVVENVEIEKEDIDLKCEENERTEAKEEQFEEKMESRTETLKVNETENVHENVKESFTGDNENEEAGDAALRISSVVKDTSIEEKAKEEVKEDTKEKTVVMKPSPQPRKKIPPQTSPKVDNLNDAAVVSKGKEEEDKSSKTLSVRDRISRLQMNAQPVTPVAPIRKSPRNVVTKPKPHPLGPVKVEGSITSSGKKSDTSETDQIAPTAKTAPLPKRIPTQRTDPPTRNESKEEEEVPELPASGGVKALIMRFQGNQSQFSSVQRQTEVAS